MDSILSSKLSAALEQTTNGKKLLQGALVIERDRQVMIAKARHTTLIEAQKARFTELKDLVKEVWSNRPDILAHVVARNSSGSSRLWELAAEPRFNDTKMALMYAGTSLEAEKQAKLLLFPRS
jgi:4-hydroxy-3-methylbut-2-enyl diphosphate reductase IspH